MTDDELSAKGNGGLRQMYNYTTDYSNTINTPEDKAVSNTIGNEGMTMDKIMAQREADVSKLIPQQKFNTR